MTKTQIRYSNGILFSVLITLGLLSYIPKFSISGYLYPSNSNKKTVKTFFDIKIILDTRQPFQKHYSQQEEQ